jgi:EAL domain-containing protein (putative c-di-GMP-specific phosphodiesterase class I)
VESTEAMAASVFPRPRIPADDTLEMRRLLKLARIHLGMEVAAVLEVFGDQYVIRTVDGGPTSLNFQVDQYVPLADSFCRRILAGELPQVISAARQFPPTRDLPVTAEVGIGAYVGVPLYGASGEVLGMLCAVSSEARPDLDAKASRFLALIAELVAEHLAAASSVEREVHQAEVARLRDVLSADFIRMVFQPVVSLETGETVAYEALARFDDPYFPTPAHAFAAATRAGVGVELEHLAVQQAFARRPDIPAGLWLGVNLSAEALLSPAVQRTLLSQAGQNIGVEVTEHTAVEDYGRLTEVTRRLHEAGIQVAVDDAGAGYASFRHILKLCPDVIKLDLEIVRDIDTDIARRALTRSLVGFAAEIGATLIAEGVETSSELATLQRLDVGFGQGYLFARPGPLPE